MPAADEGTRTQEFQKQAERIRNELGINKDEQQSTKVDRDKVLDNFIQWKAQTLDKPYGVFDYEQVPAEILIGVAEVDKDLGKQLEALEKREYALKASLSPINPMFVRDWVENRAQLSAEGIMPIRAERELRVFAVESNLENVAQLLGSEQGGPAFKEGLVERYNIDLSATPEDEQNIKIIDTIREDIRGKVSELVARHTGKASSTSNWHVTGVIDNNHEIVQKDLQVLVYDTLHKIYPEDGIDPAKAGADIMVAYAPNIAQKGEYFKLTDNIVELSYSTLGAIVPTNNALNHEQMLNAAIANNVEMSPMVLVDKIDNGQVAEGYSIASQEKKGTKLAFKAVSFTHNPDEIKALQEEVANGLPERISPQLSVAEMRELQKINVSTYIPARLLEKQINDRFARSKQSSLDITFAEAITSELSVAGSTSDETKTLMADITGYSKASRYLAEVDMDAAPIFRPMINKIADVARLTGGLQNDFAGDSLRVIYVKDQELRKLYGADYKPSAFFHLKEVERTFLLSIAAHQIKANYEGEMTQVVANTAYGAAFIENLNSAGNADWERVKTDINNESNANVKNAKAFLYAKARIEQDGKFGIKSLSVSGDCTFSYGQKRTSEELATAEGSRIEKSEHLSAQNFDAKREVLENVARSKGIAVDSQTFNSITDETLKNLFEQTPDPKSSEIVYVLDIEEALKVPAVKDVLETLQVPV